MTDWKAERENMLLHQCSRCFGEETNQSKITRFHPNSGTQILLCVWQLHGSGHLPVVLLQSVEQRSQVLWTNKCGPNRNVRQLRVYSTSHTSHLHNSMTQESYTSCVECFFVLYSPCHVLQHFYPLNCWIIANRKRTIKWIVVKQNTFFKYFYLSATNSTD